MSFSLTVNGHTYNDDDYNVSTNPYGLGGGGFRILLGINGAFLTDLLTDLSVTLQMSATDSLAIGTGSKTFTPATLRAVPVGCYIQASYDATNWMYGYVASKTATQVTLTVMQTSGSGTYAAWTLQALGPPNSGIFTTTTISGLTATLIGALTAGSQQITGGEFRNPVATEVNIGTFSGTYIADLATANVFKGMINGNALIVPTNYAASGKYQSFQYRILMDASHTLTVQRSLGNAVTWDSVLGAPTLAASKVAVINLDTDDGGTTVMANFGGSF